MKAKDIIERLGLEPHPEGGFFRETYRSKEHVLSSKSQDRSIATAIYYLVTPGSFSALHRVASDETFHFYYGDPVEMLLLLPNGKHEIITIGPNILEGHLPQFTVPGSFWQGSRLKHDATNFSLLGTTVYPGFDFADFELGVRASLTQGYPTIAGLIEKYTRE